MEKLHIVIGIIYIIIALTYAVRAVMKVVKLNDEATKDDKMKYFDTGMYILYTVLYTTIGSIYIYIEMNEH